MSAKTATLERTPKPYGKPGGPGLYGKAGNKHSDYFEQIVGAMMKNGKSKGEASAMAWGILRRWAKGGGHVTPAVRAAAVRALAQEKAAGAVHAHANVPDDILELFNANHGPGGQFASAQGAGKAAKLKTLKGKLASVQSQIKTTRTAIIADQKAKAATKKSASKTIGKTAKQQAASAKASAKAKATSKSTTAKKSTAKKATLAQLQTKLAGLRTQRASIVKQIRTVQKG